MTKWLFRNWTHCTPAIRVQSADHAAELLLKQSSGTEYGVILEFLHDERGLVSCIANSDRSTLTFVSEYDPERHSLRGKRMAFRVKPVSKEPFYFIDSTGVASSIPESCLLPILKVARALKHIVEHHECLGGIRWSDPVDD